MVNEPEICPECGAPKSGWLEDNCPSCLIRLGAPGLMGKPTRADAALSERAGIIRALGDYELLDEIARGGMGVVFRARQVSLNRLVAVKVLLAAQSASDTHRFRREAQMAASLSHPNIVSIYEVGEHAGQPYFSMELIEGRSLAELSRDRPLGVRRAAELTKTIAEAVHFAHGRHLLHRDLKPSNVLVDTSGAPHVTDFGLAKRSDGEADLTLTGQVLGTPNYMPPEQAKGSQSSVTGDVYSLGAILYQLLTGRAPFLAETVTQTLRLVIESEAISLRLLNPSVPRDLETVCLKCLEKEPARRYGSAQELADELGRFLRDEPIRARPISAPAKLIRWRRRKPSLALSIGACAALLLVIAIGSSVATFRINNERNRAEAARKQEAALRVRAELAERNTEQKLYTALLEQARATVRSGELGQRVRTLDAVRRAAAISNTLELRREAFAALGLPDLSFERKLPTGLDCTMTALDPKFERLALGRGTKAVEIRAVSDQSLLATLPPAGTSQLAETGKWSPDGRFFAVRRKRLNGQEAVDVEIWEVASGRRVVSLPPTPWGAFSFHPNQPRVLGADVGDTVSVWDLEEGRKLASFSVPGSVHHVAFSPDGQSFLVQHRIESPWFTSLHDAETGAVRTSKLTGWIDGIAWDPHDRWIAFAWRTGDIILHDQQSDTDSVLGRHKSEARTAAFSPDGDFLFTGGEEQEIICWDLRTQRRAFTIGLQSAQIQFPAEGSQCAIATKASVLLHSLERSVPCRELTDDLGGTHRHAAISSDGRWLAASGAARLGLWDLNRVAPPVIALEAEYATPFFSPDSSELFAFTRNRFARWAVKAVAGTTVAPPRLMSLPAPTTNRVYSGQFTSDSLVLGTTNGVLVAPRTDLFSDAQRIRTGAYVCGEVSANGLWLAARMLKVTLAYRLKPWQEVCNVRVGGELVAHAFTPGSDELAVASTTGVTFLDTNRWEPQRRLAASLDRNCQLIFIPDGRAFWLARDARTAALHDTRTLETLLPLPTGMIPLAVSPDGRHLAVSVDSRRVQVWDLVEVRNQLRAIGLDWIDGQSDAQTAKR